VALDESRPLDDRITALDNLEMLVEQIDNANNITPLNMWGSLINLSKSEEDEIRQYGLWIIGTAIQNNPKAQHSYLSYNPLPHLISVLTTANQQWSPRTRSKAVYCISNALRHNARAVQGFDSLGGWSALAAALQDSSIIVRRKVAFLLLTLILQDGPSHSAADSVPASSNVQSHLPAPLPDDVESNTNGLASSSIANAGILKDLLRSIVTPLPHGPDGDTETDVDLEEKSVKAVLAYVRLGVKPLEPDEQELLSKGLGKFGKAEALERWSLAADEWSELEKAAR